MDTANGPPLKSEYAEKNYHYYGSSLFSMGKRVRFRRGQVALRYACSRTNPTETASFPPEAGPCHLFRFALEQASLRALGVTAFCVRAAPARVPRCGQLKRKGF